MFPVEIPTNQSFLSQWYHWTHAKVKRHFRRDKERMMDTVQAVRTRLLNKDFIGRWFFKDRAPNPSLIDELVTRTEAERILGGTPITYISSIEPKQGRRSDPDSLWMIRDLLEYAKFDYERYYYSIQGHTIDTPHVLRLLGYWSAKELEEYTSKGKLPKIKNLGFSSLQSLYRQGRLLPSEMTEHVCIESKDCLGCKHGRQTLYNKSLSLVHDWNDESVRANVLKLRWNDNQLGPYLRGWRNSNKVKSTPRFIMRPTPNKGIEAGLLRNAQIIIDNEVANDFKRLARADDLTITVLNNGMSPEYSNDEHVGLERSDDEEASTIVLCDIGSLSSFSNLEDRMDLEQLIERANLTEEEEAVLIETEISESTAKNFSRSHEIPVNKVNKLRSSALNKLRDPMFDSQYFDLARTICIDVGCNVDDLLGPAMFGPVVTARTRFFSALNDLGMTVKEISKKFSFSEEKVMAAISRSRRLSSQPSAK
jgi:DNA-directed RNA polymerase specialized sigma24 family protein